MKRTDYSKRTNQIGCGYCSKENICKIRNPKINSAKLGCKQFEHFNKTTIMKKSNEELIAAFKKANKVRRVKIADKVGLTTDEYLLSLMKKTKKKVKAKQKMVDYVIAFDTTGSMTAFINNVKNHVNTIIPEMFSQDIDLKMKIVAFGDYCDMRGENDFGNAYQQSDFTDDKNELIKFVTHTKSTSGGDSDEFYELVIKKIVEETPWREGSTRTVLFIADCNPHDFSYHYFGKQRNIDWRKEAKKAAKARITFDTISIHGKSYPWYKKLAKMTGGIYLPFSSQEKTSEVVTASLYARGSKMSKSTFTISYDTALKSGDTELIGVYKSLSTLL